ncbi:MAG: DMT family transporter [Streptococcaceae bacterium]|jgi:drug/metabolite transporter (DMT)-like permease|nr:DMT family transporter [Streptococcaceae bacterium]
MKSKLLTGALLCLTAVVFWGGMFPVMARVLTHIDPFYFTLVRYGSVAIILSILLVIFEGKSAFRTEGHLLSLWLLGTSAFAGFSFLVFLGQQLAGPSGSVVASVMMAVQPLLAVLVGWVWKRNRPKTFAFLCMLVALIGVILVVTKGNLTILISAGAPALLILIGALCWVIYSTGVGNFPSWSILRYSALTTILGMVSVILILLIATTTRLLHFPKLTELTQIPWETLYMIVPAGVIALFAWNLGNRQITTLNGILFMNLVPITAFIINALTGYKFGLYEIIGCLLVILALIANNLYNRKA